jgi:hypothetical protein
MIQSASLACSLELKGLTLTATFTLDMMLLYFACTLIQHPRDKNSVARFHSGTAALIPSTSTE